jgi:oligopeptidase A
MSSGKNNIIFAHSREFPGSNPLLQHQSLPKFAKISSSDVEPAMNECLAVAKADFINVETALGKGTQTQSYASTIEALEIIQYPMSYSWGVVNHLMGVKNSEELRKSHEAVQPNVIAFSQRVGQSRLLFRALTAFKKNKKEWETLDGAQQRIVEASLRDMEKSGVGLSKADREVLNKLQLEVSELSTKFANNVLDSTNSFKLKLTNVSDVEGLPLSAKALAAERAKTEGSIEVCMFSLYCLCT